MPKVEQTGTEQVESSENVFEGDGLGDSMDLSNKSLGLEEEQGGSEEDTSDGGETSDDTQTEKKETDEENESDSADDDTKAEDDNESSENENSDNVTDDGIKTIDDAVKMHKEDQKYITELQTKSKQMSEILGPLMSEDSEGNMVLDPAKLQGLAQQGKPQEIDPVLAQKANKDFWVAFDKSPIETMYKIVFDAQKAANAGLEKKINAQENVRSIDSLHNSKYKEYGDMRAEVKKIVDKNPNIGIEQAYDSILLKALPQIIADAKNGKVAPVSKSKKSLVVGKKTGEQGNKELTVAEQMRKDIMGAQDSADTVFE